MKNIIKRYITGLTGCLALVLCLTVSSCSDTLNSAPDGKIALNDVFNDNEMTAAYLNTCYTYIPAEGAQWYFCMRGPVVWCDEAWDTDAEAEGWLTSGQLYNGSASAVTHPAYEWSSMNNGDHWNRNWTAIRKCTYFLTHIDGATVTSEANRSRWKAEAHLLRAYYYSELLRWLGCSLPIERELYSLDYDFSIVKRSSYYEVAQFILEDCDAALSSPELPWRITTDAEGYRFTKAVAEAIKSRMSVYMASPLYNQGQNCWEEAYQVNKTALANLKAQGYELYNRINYPATWGDPEAFFPNDYAALFNEYFCNNMAFGASPVDRETLYQNQYDQIGVWNLDGVGAQDGYKSGTCPSQELVDCFETTDGQPILNPARPYLDEVTHLQPNFNPANTLYDEQDPYANRDPRFYASIYYNGSKRKADWRFEETTGSVENYPADRGFRVRIIATWDGEPQTGIHPTSRKATRTGYFERKFLHPFSGMDAYYIFGAHHKSFRLGEVILNYAEAAAEANHLDEARAAVNEIRSRVGMPNLPAGLSKDELVLRIRNERRVELAMEGHRYFDVRRWNTPDGNLEKTDRWINAMWITRNDDGSYTYKRGPVSRERLCWTQKFMWLPIPMNEVNILKSLTGEDWQNPGW
ncbi:MAG: RagB/SusD family nutrient uptake outer membrane protein [Tannerella sp.]|nr:RagB/SusD family nutrient uptake outer membrane protein [Tannerella sp.]